MPGKFMCIIIAFAFLFLPVFAEDTLTITTYYPSPYGVYRELRAKRIAIGDDYIDGANYTWQDTESGSGEVDFNADLVVEGNVGIGTVNPVVKLDVVNISSAGLLGSLRLLGRPSADNQEVSRINFATYNASPTNNIVAYIRSFRTYDSDDGILRFGTGNTADPTDRMTIDENGSVGIGTTAPNGKTEITGRLVLSDGGGANRYALNLESNTAATGYTAINAYNYATSSPAKLILNESGGNVGIGTTSPSGALDVRNSGNSGIRMADANGNVIEGILGGALGTLWLNYTSTGNVLLANGGGNVGIGTVSPRGKLDVAGPIYLTSGGDIAGGVRLYNVTRSANATCSNSCLAWSAGEGTCLAAFTSAGAASTCATSATNQRCLCVGTGG